MANSIATPRVLKRRPRNTSKAVIQLDGATEVPDQETDIEDWLSKVGPSTEPPSTTAICRTSYSFERLPKIHAIPIKVTSIFTPAEGVEDEFCPIYSSKLRKLAIDSLIKQEIPGLRKKFALKLAEDGFSTAAERGLTDYILVLNMDMDQPTESKLHALATQGRIHVPAISKQFRNKKTDEAVYCDLGAEELVSVGTDTPPKKYWKMLKLLIREVTVRSIPSNGFLSDCKEILFKGLADDPESPVKADFTTKTSVSSDWLAFSSMKSEDALLIKEASIFKVLFRSNVKIDPANKALHVEFDLVPGLENGIHLSDLVLRILGPGVLTKSGDTNLSTIRSMLLGLHVERDHGVPDRSATIMRAAATGQDHSTGDLSHGSPRAGADAPTQDAESSGSSMDTEYSARKNHFVIRNIKLPGEVLDFRIGREKFSVHKYFHTSELFQSALPFL
jgi:hypothetical protein